MLAAGQEILFATDMLIPVPLHWKRLWFRQYNQSALLASHLSVHTGIQLRSDILKRHRSTPKQGMKNRKARHDNVRKAFSVSSRKAAFCKGQRITLIDDVFTTGATLGECAKTLLSAGAKEIRVLTLARVVQPGYI
jgi:ComF family protein